MAHGNGKSKNQPQLEVVKKDDEAPLNELSEIDAIRLENINLQGENVKLRAELLQIQANMIQMQNAPIEARLKEKYQISGSDKVDLGSRLIVRGSKDQKEKSAT